MTAPVRVRQTDLSNAAKIAKDQGVSIRIEVGGMTIHVDPRPALDAKAEPEKGRGRPRL